MTESKTLQVFPIPHFMKNQISLMVKYLPTPKQVRFERYPNMCYLYKKEGKLFSSNGKVAAILALGEHTSFSNIEFMPDGFYRLHRDGASKDKSPEMLISVDTGDDVKYPDVMKVMPTGDDTIKAGGQINDKVCSPLSYLLFGLAQAQTCAEDKWLTPICSDRFSFVWSCYGYKKPIVFIDGELTVLVMPITLPENKEQDEAEARALEALNAPPVSEEVEKANIALAVD